MKLKSLVLSLVFALGFSAPAWANLPWGSTAPLEVSGATPTCTYTSTALACIEDMTANVTSVTLAGMTAGTYYTIVFMQDGTGSRTLTQASITQATGGLAVPAIPSTANQYTAWIIKATSASAATFVQNYDNVSLLPFFTATQTTNGTAVAPGAYQLQPTIVVPGMIAGSLCLYQAQTLPSTWQTGIIAGCLSLTNAVQGAELNPTAATITPAAVSANLRIIP